MIRHFGSETERKLLNDILRLGEIADDTNVVRLSREAYAQIAKDVLSSGLKGIDIFNSYDTQYSLQAVNEATEFLANLRYEIIATEFGEFEIEIV